MRLVFILEAVTTHLKNHSIWYANFVFAAAAIKAIESPVQTAMVVVGFLIAITTLAIKSHQMIGLYYKSYKGWKRKKRRAKRLFKNTNNS